MLERCGVSPKTYSDYAIPLERSVDRVRAELRSTKHLANPNDTVQFLQGMGGDYLHHDFVNFDVIAKSNMASFKEQLCGRAGHRMVKVHILPDDDCVEKMTKDELIAHLTATISAAYSGQDRDVRMSLVRRTTTKAGLITLLHETEEASE